MVSEEEQVSYPKLAVLDRWLAGGSPEVVRHTLRPTLPGRDLYGVRPEVDNDQHDIRSLLGTEHFSPPVAEQPKRRRKPKRVNIGKLARMLARNTNTIAQWCDPPGASRPDLAQRFRRKLPRPHRTPGGVRFFWDDEVQIIMDQAVRDKLVTYDEAGQPVRHSLDMRNFTTRVTERIEVVRAGRPCVCKACKPPLVDSHE